MNKPEKPVSNITPSQLDSWLVLIHNILLDCRVNVDTLLRLHNSKEEGIKLMWRYGFTRQIMEQLTANTITELAKLFVHESDSEISFKRLLAELGKLEKAPWFERLLSNNGRRLRGWSDWRIVNSEIKQAKQILRENVAIVKHIEHVRNNFTAHTRPPHSLKKIGTSLPLVDDLFSELQKVVDAGSRIYVTLRGGLGQPYDLLRASPWMIDQLANDLLELERRRTGQWPDDNATPLVP